ncbi:MAG: hypothetical protein PHH11_12850 [Methylomonas sp.]|nr:hypothetical protein [Methylomonas sp.]
MAELLFIATTVFVAYVLFEVVGSSKKESSSTQLPASKPDSNPTPAATSAEEVSTVAEIAKPVSKESTKVETKTAKTSPAKPKKAPTKKVEPQTPADSLKNPKTGEVAKVPGNYAFAKRWIKDALVEEGLLDKVYKNNELDDDVTAKIQEALQQLKAMKKYQ